MLITVTRQHNGVVLSTVHGGYYHHLLYQGYTLREAKQHFRAYVRGRIT